MGWQSCEHKPKLQPGCAVAPSGCGHAEGIAATVETIPRSTTISPCWTGRHTVDQDQG